MATYAAFLRAINVGGTGKLPMADLRELCEGLGLRRVQTYVQSGNVVFQTRKGAARVHSELEGALAERMGKPVPVLLRREEELATLIEQNPFPKAQPNRLLVYLTDATIDEAAVARCPTPGGEHLQVGTRSIYVWYPEGQGRSKLKVPHAKEATARNLRTLGKVLDLMRTPS